MRYKKSLFIFLVIFGLLAAGSVLAVPWLPLVSCGTSAQGYTPCTFCDIFHLIKNVFDFLSFEVAPALAAVMVAVAGFFILTAGDSPQRLGTGKTILQSVVISLIIIYASWLVINTALTLFANPTGGSGFFSFTCKAPPEPGSLPGGGGGEKSTVCAKTDANKITYCASKTCSNPSDCPEGYGACVDKSQCPENNKVCAKTEGEQIICSSKGCFNAPDCYGEYNLCVDKSQCPGASPAGECVYDNPDYASACAPIPSSINCSVQQDKCYTNKDNAQANQVITAAKDLRDGGVKVTGALGKHSGRCGSFHPAGCALDFSGFESHAEACIFATKAGNIVGTSHVRNEYSFDCSGYPANPSGGSTGGHIHVTTCSIKPADCPTH